MRGFIGNTDYDWSQFLGSSASTGSHEVLLTSLSLSRRYS